MNSSIQVLESAKRGGEGVDKGRHEMGSILPIQAHKHKCSNWQKRGWWAVEQAREAQFCQFKHLCARIGKNEGCLGKDRFNFANSSTCVLELAELRWGWLAKSGKTWFCQFEHATARIGRTKVRGWSDKSGETRFCQFEHLHA